MLRQPFTLIKDHVDVIQVIVLHYLFYSSFACLAECKNRFNHVSSPFHCFQSSIT